MRTGKHWLQWATSNILFLSFEPNRDGTVHVKGPLGACSYISRTMSAEEARAYYREKRANDWHVPAADDIPSYHTHEAHTYGL
jgi:hypothetical protein